MESDFLNFHFNGIKLRELDEWRVVPPEIGWKKIPENGWELNPWYQF